jgi:phage repressor protein C with HTH and peptisase S24 domain
MTNNAGIAYGELIRRQRKAKKMNQEELGALVKVGKNAVGAWEAGRSRPDVGSVPVICEALDISLEEFFGYPDKSGENIYDLSGIRPDERATLLRKYSSLNQYNRQVILRQMSALYDMQNDMQQPRKVIRLFRNELAASAGIGETLDAVRGEEVYLFADQVPEAADEIIRVNGNSMEPTYYDGDLVLVKHTSSVRPGEIGVFIVGDTGYIKEYQKDGLHSHNPSYGTIAFTEGEDVHIAGKVLGKVDKDDWADEESFAAWQEYEQKGR